MTTVIIIIVLIVIGKFIYDSYLTNKTDERWQEYKKSDPHNARRIERSKFGAESDKDNINHQADITKQKKNLVSQRIKEELTEYQRKSLIEIEEDFGEIKGNIVATLKATDIINSNSDLFKLEFFKKKTELELNERELAKLIDDVARSIIKDKLGINFNEKKENQITRKMAFSILSKRVVLKEGANYNIAIHSIEFGKYSNEAVLNVDAFNSCYKKEAQELFLNSEYGKAINIFTKIHVKKELGYKFQELKLATIYCVNDNNNILVKDIIPQNEII